MPTKTWREETVSLRSQRSKKADGALIKTEDITSATKVSPNVDAYQGIQPWNRLYYGVYEDLQETEAFDRLINEKNAWFRPHIKYTSLKNGPDFTFAEKIQLQNALDQITKVSRIAKSYCAHAQSLMSITGPHLKPKPLRLPTSGQSLSREDEKLVKCLDRMCSGTNAVIVITDIRDPYNPEIANKSYQDVITWESKIDVAQDGSAVYVGSNFFRFGLTPEQRTIILYRSFFYLACYQIDNNHRGLSGLMEQYPESTNRVLLLFKEIQDALTLAGEQSRVEKAAAEAQKQESQARLNKAKAQKQRKQAERFAAERSKGYTMFPAYDQKTSLSKSIKNAIQRAMHKAWASLQDFDG